MEDRERLSKLSPEIYVYATNKNFFNVYDALRINKIKLEIAGYDQTTNRQTGHASAWLDLHDARLLVHLICSRLFPQVTGGRWEKYGGSQREDGSIESRTISFEWDEGEGGKFARFPYRVTIANGPGKKTATGGVSPAGEPTARLSMRIPEADLMKLMLALGDYVRAYEAAHHHRLVAQKLRDLREKLSDRPLRVESGAPVIERGRPAASTAPVATGSGLSERPSLRSISGGNRVHERSLREDKKQAV